MQGRAGLRGSRRAGRGRGWGGSNEVGDDWDTWAGEADTADAQAGDVSLRTGRLSCSLVWTKYLCSVNLTL